MDDIHADGKGRFWLRLLHRNNTETWHEIPSWLWHEILNRPPYWPLSKSFNHPVFSSPRHPDHFYSIQEINRKLRRYAELAGVRTNIRIQDLRGVLMEQAPVEAQPYNMIAECMSSRSLNRDHRLHGIGRRSAAMGVGNG
jgi:lipopolysaccharide biosynthesis glycosyltransferase